MSRPVEMAGAGANAQSALPVRAGDRPVDEARAAPASQYSGPTYYDRSPVKSSPYGGLVWWYAYIAGLAGSAQIIAAIASCLRRPALRGMVRNGRYLALLAPTAGNALLIADLHTPARWYNMLRIFRKTSPMSIGTYLLSAFGVSSAIAAAAEMLGHVPGLRWLRLAGGLAQVPAALTGAGMSTYTGALLSATSTPYWAAAPRLLTARFACSAMATAASALSLGELLRGERRNSAALDKLACAAVAADTVLSLAGADRYRSIGALKEEKIATEWRLADGVGHWLPLACHAANGLMRRPSPALSVAAALGVLAGGLMMRTAVFHTGNRSAQRPEDGFALTQPRAAAQLEETGKNSERIGA